MTEALALADPMLSFQTDRQRAKEANDPMAAVCVLATVDAAGLPQARTLVLRDVAEGLAIYINASSPKWLQSQNVVAIQTWWPSVQIQYRMHAVGRELSSNHVAQSWLRRPDAPKHMDWLYEQTPQSSPVGSRADLLALLDLAEHPQPLVAPPGARGLLLRPQTIERLDLNQTDGVHDRKRFVLEADRWRQETLVP